jgi:hypothetical protein
MKTLLLTLTLAAATMNVAAATAKKEVLPFIANDYAKAVAQAKAKNVPLFVETWAPW